MKKENAVTFKDTPAKPLQSIKFIIAIVWNAEQNSTLRKSTARSATA